MAHRARTQGITRRALVSRTATAVALTVLGGFAGCTADKSGPEPETEESQADAPSDNQSPTRDPNGPWSIPAKGRLTQEELSYAVVCVSWDGVVKGVPGLFMDGSTAGVAAESKNTGLMEAVDAARNDIAATGSVGATSFAAMDEFCQEVESPK
jgi:hypothetical protein